MSRRRRTRRTDGANPEKTAIVVYHSLGDRRWGLRWRSVTLLREPSPTCRDRETGQPLDTPALLFEFDASQPAELPPHPAMCLDGFIRLADGSDDRLLTFARTWGPLDLCKHGVPRGHAQFNPFADCNWRWYVMEEAGVRRLGIWEPVEAWHRLSRSLRAILNVAADHQDGKLGTAEDWKVIREGDRRQPGDAAQPSGSVPPADSPTRTPMRLALAEASPAWARLRYQAELGMAVNRWFGYGGLTVAFRPEPDGSPALALVAESSLSGGLARALAATLTARAGMHRCGYCGTPFTPASGWTPRSDKRPCCWECKGRKPKLASWHRNKGRWPSTQRRSARRDGESS